MADKPSEVGSRGGGGAGTAQGDVGRGVTEGSGAQSGVGGATTGGSFLGDVGGGDEKPQENMGSQGAPMASESAHGSGGGGPGVGGGGPTATITGGPGVGGGTTPELPDRMPAGHGQEGERR